MGVRGKAWSERALCVGEAELFTVRDFKSNGESFSELKWKGYEKAKFKEAVEICRHCPVQQECGEAASPEDFQWTVRAGRMPSAFNTTTKGRPSTVPAPGVHIPCPKGHAGGMKITSSGKRRCYPCEREARQEKHPTKPAELKNTCANGHVGAYEYEQRPGGKRFCRKCKDGWREIAKVKAAKMEA